MNYKYSGKYLKIPPVTNVYKTILNIARGRCLILTHLQSIAGRSSREIFIAFCLVFSPCLTVKYNVANDYIRQYINAQTEQ